ncbi:unnamed protein product [Ranitomeya imitator]|uniref:LRRK2 beta-propeller domain-containing protein n=1 Tax=Ranitomeya imitator TaxID=111125 RepID=A0ABN9KW58_9NEOB|nr:unnamed protein product [Ranitomeya imitator]
MGEVCLVYKNALLTIVLFRFREEIAKQRKLNKEDAYTARVKAMFLQKNTALWVGTGGGHILLIDISTRRPIRIISSFCDSIRCMVPSQLDKGNVKKCCACIRMPQLTT